MCRRGYRSNRIYSRYRAGFRLGDRIRMGSLAGDDGVFIRSMATRGRMGGLAQGTIEAATILEAAGFDRILIETVGVGQDEVDIVGAADISIVVLVPGMGDDVQAIKPELSRILDIASRKPTIISRRAPSVS